MEILQKIIDFLSKVPEWAYLYLVPALIFATAFVCIFVKKRRWFFVAAAIAGAAGFSFVYVKNSSFAVVYLAILIALCATLSLFFLIPPPKRKQKRSSREEKIFEKFHEALSEKPYTPRTLPPKERCFEKEEVGATATERGMDLSYADTLLEQLRSKKINAGDRLEAEEIRHRLDCYRNKALGEEERSSLNDCLASILKLTAKYGL